eukprot:UN32426
MNEIDDDKRTIFHYACMKNTKQVMLSIIKAINNNQDPEKIDVPDLDAYLKMKDIHNYTPLFLAIRYDNIDIVQQFWDKAQTTKFDDTYAPMFIAAQYGAHRVLNWILQWSELEEKDRINEQIMERGLTPLLMATKSGHSKAVEELLRNKADVNLETKNGNTPLLYATKFNHEHVFNILMKKDYI